MVTVTITVVCRFIIYTYYGFIIVLVGKYGSLPGRLSSENNNHFFVSFNTLVTMK